MKPAPVYLTAVVQKMPEEAGEGRSDCARPIGWCHAFRTAEEAKQAYPGAKLVVLLSYEEAGEAVTPPTPDPTWD